MTQFIPQMEPWFGHEEKAALAAYMDEGGWLTEFRQTAAFEQALADFTKAKHCIAVTSGTTALMAIMWSLDLGPGDEVIVPNFTMIATANAVVAAGATPVFVDVEPETLCIDFDKVKAAITSKTKALVFMTANGRYPTYDIADLRGFCEDQNISFVEDSCQALGSFYPDGTHMGLASCVGTLSFSVPKIITTGQGGALLTNDDVFADKLRRMKDFGRSGGGNDIHATIGYNFKITEMQAVIGLAQMEKLAWRVNRKKEIFARYQSQLADIDGISFFQQDLSCTTPWFIDLLADNRADLQAHLKDKGFGTRVMYPPINRQDAYKVAGEHPVSDLVGEKGLWLPSAAQLTDEQIDQITSSVRAFYEGR